MGSRILVVDSTMFVALPHLVSPLNISGGWGFGFKVGALIFGMRWQYNPYIGFPRLRCSHVNTFPDGPDIALFSD